MVFGSKNAEIRKQCDQILESAISHYCMKVIGWRDVPTANNCLGEIALAAEPSIRQIFVHGIDLQSDLFERRLYMARRRAERIVREKLGKAGEDFYVTSLSCRTICYKGMFMARQLFAYYPDLADKRVQIRPCDSSPAIQHQYISELAIGAAVSLHSAQRRNQYAQRKP